MRFVTELMQFINQVEVIFIPKEGEIGSFGSSGSLNTGASSPANFMDSAVKPRESEPLEFQKNRTI